VVPGGPNFELSYASSAVLPYLLSLSGEGMSDDILELKKIVNQRIATHESRLMTPLLDYLKSRKSEGVRILGIEEGDSSRRAPTISFVVDGKSSKQIAESLDAKDVLSITPHVDFRLVFDGECFMQTDFVKVL